MQRSLVPARQWGCVIAVSAVVALSACKPTSPEPKMGVEPSTPSAVSPVASSADVPALPNTPDTSAVQGLLLDKATVAQAAQVDKQTAPPVSPPAAASKAAGAAPVAASGSTSPLSELSNYLGDYPSDGMNYLEQGVLAERLQQMLGKDYATLLANMRTVAPLTEDQGRWYLSGNRPHEGGKEAAAIVIDAAQNAVRVWLLHEGKATEYLEPTAAQVEWPQDIKTLQSNAAS